MRLAKDTRQALGVAIEALIALLDAIGPDPEAEPSLATPEQMDQAGAGRDPGAGDDREDEHDGSEPDEDREPFLGSLNRVNQDWGCWTNGSGWYVEEGEPSLAVPEQLNQARSWAQHGNRQDLEGEHDGREPETDTDDPGSEDVPVFRGDSGMGVARASFEARLALAALLSRLKPNTTKSKRRNVSGFLEKA